MTTQEQQAITDLVMRQIAIRRGSSTRRDFEVVCLVLDVVADLKCDEPAKPEVGPMQDAESLSGVQALGSSGLATTDRLRAALATFRARKPEPTLTSYSAHAVNGLIEAIEEVLAP